MTVSHVENRSWVLRIKDVKESDKGWYMCQINTVTYLVHILLHNPFMQLCFSSGSDEKPSGILEYCRWVFNSTSIKQFQLMLFTFASIIIVPPDILDYPTSTDMVVREGSNVTLKCAARGSPTPNITWRREGSEPIVISGHREGINN